MGTQDRAFVDCPLHRGVVEPAGALGDRPLRDRVLLRLHGAEMPYHGDRVGQRCHGQVLVVQPAVGDLQAVHEPAFY